jgi:hypothetical protein
VGTNCLAGACSLISSSILRKNIRGSSGGQIVAMMQAAKPWHRNDSATRFAVTRYFAASRRSLRQRKMSSVHVVIADVLIHEAFQMTFVENDRMVKLVAAAVPDSTLRNTVLPWTSEAGPLGLDAEAPRRLDHFFIELCAAIEDKITRRRFVRKCLTQLLNNPGTTRMLRDVAGQDAPPVMCNDEEAIENAEGERRHGEEVHRGNLLQSNGDQPQPNQSHAKSNQLFWTAMMLLDKIMNSKDMDNFISRQDR